MENFGAYIKQQRERHNISIDEVIKETKISREILVALEDDRQDSLPPLPYVKGFIRSYSLFLGIDPLETIYQYLQFYPQEQNHSIIFKDEKPTVDFFVNKPLTLLIKKNKSKAIIFVSTILIMAMLVVSIIWIQGQQLKKEIDFKNFSDNKLVKSLISNNDDNLQNSQKNIDKTILNNKGAMSNESVTNLAGIESAEEKSKEIVLSKHNQADNTNVANYETNIKKYNFIQKTDNSITKDIVIDHERLSAPATERKSEAIDGEMKIVEIRAEDLTWIDIKIDSGKSYDIIMRPGERLELKAKKGFELTIGNAAGVELFYEGNSLGILGESKEVVHIQLPLRNQN